MSSGPLLQRIRRLGRSAQFSAALLLLLAVGADVAADTRCHPLPGDGVRAGLTAAQPPTDQDPCRSGCVPDCFCCSALSVSAIGLPLEAVAPAGCVASAAERDCPPGIHPAPYHPPIVLS